MHGTACSLHVVAASELNEEVHYDFSEHAAKSSLKLRLLYITHQAHHETDPETAIP